MQIVIDIDEKDLRLIELHQPCELTEEYLETIFMKIENGTPLEKVLEDIKAEIEEHIKNVKCSNDTFQDFYETGERHILEIIDKHISGKE